MIAMVSGGIAGVLAFIGLSILLHRRLTDPRIRNTSRTSDIALLVLLWVQLVLGLATIPLSAQHLDGGMMLKLAEWAQRIVTFRGGAQELLAEASWVFKAHMFLGMTHVPGLPVHPAGPRVERLRHAGLRAAAVPGGAHPPRHSQGVACPGPAGRHRSAGVRTPAPERHMNATTKGGGCGSGSCQCGGHAQQAVPAINGVTLHAPGDRLDAGVPVRARLG